MTEILNTTHNSGFFSCCNVRLNNIITYFNTYKKLPKIVNSSRQFEYFKNNTNKDISQMLFKNMDDIIDYESEIKVTKSKLEDQFSDYKLINFNYVNKFIKKYFSPTDLVLDRIEFLIKKYSINLENTISVYYRGNDKISETNIGSYEIFYKKIQEIKEKYPEMDILIQTDEEDFIEYCKNKINKFIIFEELPRIKKDNNMVVHKIIDDKESFVLDFFSVTNIIAKSKILITHSGNCGLWAIYLRGNSNNVYQYLNPLDIELKENWF